MSETRVLQQGLQLMAQAPFQRSLSPNFTDGLQGDNMSRAVHFAANAALPEFSDATRFLKQRSALADARDVEIHTRGTTTHAHLLSPQLQHEVSSADGASYLKLNLLAEHAMTCVPQDTQLMTLPQLTALKKQIGDLNETRSEIESQLKSNSHLVENTFLSNGHSGEDKDIVATIVSSNSALMDRLFEITAEIFQKQQTLSTQYVMALAFTHIDHMTSESIQQMQNHQQQRTAEDRQTDELLSYIASMAVQRNVMLPPPNDDSTMGKTQWVKSCVDALLETQNISGATTRDVQTSGDSTDKAKAQVYKLKTALQDLQFAHNYLTKQYEGERAMNTSIADQHKKKRVALENQLAETAISLERSNQRTILIEHEKNVLEAKLNELTSDLQYLQKQTTQLRLDSLGYVHDASPLSPVSDKENTPSSPMTGIAISIDSNEQNPKTPLLQQGVIPKFSSSGTPTSPMKFNSSISVMRGEFKKMVTEMQKGYESKLEEEQTERRRLEELVKLYEQRRGNDDDDLL